MASYFLDTSALAKLYYQESGSDGIGPGTGGRRERPRPSAARAGAPGSPAPFRPPLVPIGWRIEDRLRGLARPLSAESALVTVLDLDATTKPAVFAEPDAPTAAHRIVLPGAFPSE